MQVRRTPSSTPSRRGQLLAGSPRASPGQGMDASGAWPQEQLQQAYQRVSSQVGLGSEPESLGYVTQQEGPSC